jgi:hypothetical protein
MSPTALLQELPPGAVALQGSVLARALLRLVGWRVHFQGLPARQGVVVVYPHTSNWDFVVLVLAKWAVGLVALDFGKREVRVLKFWRLTGQPAADMAVLARELVGCIGRRPQQAAPVRLLEN